MDSLIFLGFALAYVALGVWAAMRVARRGRVVASDLVLLVIAGLVYDNAVIALGVVIGEGGVLEVLNGARYWLHALLTPLLVIVAWHVLARSGVGWARRRWVLVIALVVTAALIVFEIVTGAMPAQLVAEREHGALSYANERAPGGPPVMVLVVAAALLLAGIVAWMRQRWPWLCIGTVLMLAGSSVPIPLPSGAATNAFELILLVAIVATVARQDRMEAEGREGAEPIAATR
ncbi:hypothetical protein [Microbacterium sp. Marseille-Q6965]|uniref:hypothetical protein n=1 Tax=Microbacterium sp. Marseille-Q6965 TaxID=2965072 RepID=UPI0021B779AC|nr:hypothetical protein [Microbacterium sp. Marseille-Q6965]